MQPGQMNSSFIPCSENTGINLNAVHSRQATNQSSLGIRNPGQMGSGFASCDNQNNLGIVQPGQMGYGFGPSKPLDATYVQQSSMRPCPSLGIMNSGQINREYIPCSNQGTFDSSNLGMIHPLGPYGTNQNNLGIMNSGQMGGFATSSIKQSHTSCSPYTDINQSSVGIIQSGQMSSGLIANMNRINSSFAPCSVNNQSNLGIMKPEQMNTSFVPCAESTRIYYPCSDSNQITSDQICTGPCSDSTMQPGLNVTTNQINPEIMQPNQTSNNAADTNTVTNENSLGIMKPEQMDGGGLEAIKRDSLNMTLQAQTNSIQETTFNTSGGLGIVQPNQMSSGLESSDTSGDLNQTNTEASLGLMQSDQMNASGSSDEQNSSGIIQQKQTSGGFEISATTGDLNQTNAEDNSGLMQSGQVNGTFNVIGATEQSGSGIIQPNQMSSSLENSVTSGDAQVLQQTPVTNTHNNLGLLQSGQVNSRFYISGGTTQSGLGVIQPNQANSANNDDLKKVLEQVPATNTQDSIKSMRSGQINSTPDPTSNIFPINKLSSKEIKIQQAIPNICIGENNLRIMQSGFPNSTANHQCSNSNCGTNILLNQGQLQTNQISSGFGQNTNISTSITPTLKRSKPSYRKIIRTTTITKKSDEDSSVRLMPSTEMQNTFGINLSGSYTSSSSKQPSYKKIIKTTTITKTPVDESSLELIQSDQTGNYFSNLQTTGSANTNESNLGQLLSGQMSNTCRSECPASISNKTTTDSSSLGLPQSNQINSAINSPFTPYTSSKASNLGILKDTTLSNSSCRSECPSRYSKSPMGSFGSSCSQNNANLALPTETYTIGNSDFNKSKTSTCRKECPSLGTLATQQTFSENTSGLLLSPNLNATDYFNNSGYIIKNGNNQMRITQSGNHDNSLGILPSNYLTRSALPNRNFGMQRTLYSPVRQFKYFNGKQYNSPLWQVPMKNYSRCINSSPNNRSLGLLSPNCLSNYNSSVRSMQDQISKIISSTPILKTSEEKEIQELSRNIELQLKTTEAAEQIKLHNDLKHYQQTRRQLVANASRIANLRNKDVPDEKN
ncbi:hypothetical protein ILUMI_26155 [Ignelater luminosus]|uniref:Uncharacterized protein n=1 Tax=Ignelater luminosus TaxID=2038154 RepID=A0A8K0FZE2_IGNLU|nr:hypothetical protein ILUMI_26155 [Ignelater luminosus]